MKKKSAAIITVRASSKRLNKKCFKKIVADANLLEIVIRRAKKIGCDVIVATSNDDSDDDIIKLAKKENIYYFRGSLLNKISRWFHCFKYFNLDAAMLVDGDDPSFSFTTQARALKKLNFGETELVKCDQSMMPGLMTYGVTKIGIEKLYKYAKEPNLDTDVIDVFLNKANLNTSVIKPVLGEELVPNIRLTIDYQEDLVFYQTLFSNISYEANSIDHIKKIIELKINKINWFRNSDFIQNQEKFNKNIKE